MPELADLVHELHRVDENQSPNGDAARNGDVCTSNSSDVANWFKPDDTSSRASSPKFPFSHHEHPSPLSRHIRNIGSSVMSSKPDTPPTRTGPPRSLSYVHSPSPTHSRRQSRFIASEDDQQANGDIMENSAEYHIPDNPDSSFRGAFENGNNDSNEKRDKGKRREIKPFEESWNPLKWFHDSPKEEKGFEWDNISKKDAQRDDAEDVDKDVINDMPAKKASVTPASSPRPSYREPAKLDTSPHRIQRSRSEHQSPSATQDRPSRGLARWGRLKSLLPNVAQQANGPLSASHSTVTHHSVNITDELITGGLSTLMLRLWFERDEKGHRRVPVLLHRLKLRINDSLHPLHGQKSVFRIEIEYANGAARWVIYRQLKDFISLHTHYTLSNAYNRNVDTLPEFPMTSLPYLHFLNKEKGKKSDKFGEKHQVGHADFARMQRKALENYLIDLIRAVMFQPASNRLAGFLEISALSIALAQSGGAQYKAGYLFIYSPGSKGGGFGRKSASRKDKSKQRWCAVRESYLVVMEEPGELMVWDVFMLDSDFKIERPKRYYRQPFHLLQSDNEEKRNDRPKKTQSLILPPSYRQGNGSSHKQSPSVVGTMKNKLSHIFHRHHATAPDGIGEGDHSSSSSSSTSTISSRPPTPMLDPSINVNPIVSESTRPEDEENAKPKGSSKGKEVDTSGSKAKEVSKHTFYIENSQMRLKLFARNERQMLQWITALEKIAATSHYTGTNRFDSFAPIRLNVAAQWLVDARDYMWNCSRAILLAKETIYIHDWWLSPELQMRRPHKEKYRLDKLLERKAKEGVKIYIILYQEVSNRTTPTDSNYTKQRLSSLHPNIMVQRSPSHFQTGTFYWAHHEKLCVIDQVIAFMGGVDLCFGRWDTPQHIIIDDADNTEENPQIWPGKDYSNPRISDFHTLDKPFEDLYDRTKVPRMPWHDVGMQIVGQPARDLARHFVQRWNYLLRIKNHSRIMPFLLPPAEFKPGELTSMGLTGTCELQICRSAGPWSLGTPARIEHSIQNAYLKAIQLSEHFVYIENQFFITSTVVSDIKVENRIGDALVHRIIRAHREGTNWKCCIVIPVLPGFAFPVDHTDASAIRIILECQNRTISRGPNSIFARLRKEGIDPDDYISVFSLRNWGKLRGNILTTEQVYIHGKVCIVDDRLAIIGSANINERSQRGDRDSELAAIIRDTDMIDCKMDGKPFKVGRFAHTLRVRLMREHIGINVDVLDEQDLMANDPLKADYEQEPWDPDVEQQRGVESGVTRIKKSKQHTPVGALAQMAMDTMGQALHASNDVSHNAVGRFLHQAGLQKKSAGNIEGEQSLMEERMTYTREGKEVPGFASAIVPTLEEKIVEEHLPTRDQTADEDKDGGQADRESEELSKKREPSESKGPEYADNNGTNSSADNRKESNGAPETEGQITVKGGELYGAPAGASKSPQTDDEPPHALSGINDASEEEQAAPGARTTIRRHLGSKLGSKWTLLTPRPKFGPEDFEDPVCDEFWKSIWVASAVHNTEIFRKVFHAIPDDLITTWKQYTEFIVHHERLNKAPKDSAEPCPIARLPSEAGDDGDPGQGAESQPEEIKDAVKVDEQHEEGRDGDQASIPTNPGQNGTTDKDTKAKKATRGTEPFEKWERDEMEKLLGQLCGHLVVNPNRFLEGEDIANNFLFNADRMLPLPIYN